jgi:hypothetical protein
MQMAGSYVHILITDITDKICVDESRKKHYLELKFVRQRTSTFIVPTSDHSIEYVYHSHGAIIQEPET